MYVTSNSNVYNEVTHFISGFDSFENYLKFCCAFLISDYALQLLLPMTT